jgi:DNA-binding MarR family transcriptional regulator
MTTSNDSLDFLSKFCRLNGEFHVLNSAINNIFGLSLVQWAILGNIISRPGISPSSLARDSKVDPSTLTPMLKRLESAHLVMIEERSNDKRSKLIVSTRKGIATYRSCEAGLVKATQPMANISLVDQNLDALQECIKGLAATIVGRTNGPEDA